MDINIIRLNHFYDKNAYCKLQEYFGSHDYKKNYEERIEEPYEDMKIIYYEVMMMTKQWFLLLFFGN